MANRPLGPKERALASLTRLVAMLLVPIAFCRAPGRARFLACQWALGMRFPAEDLRGLAPEALAAFTHARAEAFWRDGQLIGLTSGYRDPAEQHEIFAAEVRRTGSVSAARRRVLPPEESGHVRGVALDVRPTEGARWLEAHGGRYGLYRVYDNEWWHFEYRTVEPVRLPHPAAAAWWTERGVAYGRCRIHGAEPRHTEAPQRDPRTHEPRYYEPRYYEPRYYEPRFHEQRHQEPRPREPHLREPHLREPHLREPRRYEARHHQPHPNEQGPHGSRKHEPQQHGSRPDVGGDGCPQGCAGPSEDPRSRP